MKVKYEIFVWKSCCVSEWVAWSRMSAKQHRLFVDTHAPTPILLGMFEPLKTCVVLVQRSWGEEAPGRGKSRFWRDVSKKWSFRGGRAMGEAECQAVWKRWKWASSGSVTPTGRPRTSASSALQQDAKGWRFWQAGVLSWLMRVRRLIRWSCARVPAAFSIRIVLGKIPA